MKNENEMVIKGALSVFIDCLFNPVRFSRLNHLCGLMRHTLKFELNLLNSGANYMHKVFNYFCMALRD